MNLIEINNNDEIIAFKNKYNKYKEQIDSLYLVFI